MDIKEFLASVFIKTPERRNELGTLIDNIFYLLVSINFIMSYIETDTLRDLWSGFVSNMSIQALFFLPILFGRIWQIGLIGIILFIFLMIEIIIDGKYYTNAFFMDTLELVLMTRLVYLSYKYKKTAVSES